MSAYYEKPLVRKRMVQRGFVSALPPAHTAVGLAGRVGESHPVTGHVLCCTDGHERADLRH